MLSLVIPIYKNAANIEPLLEALRGLPGQLAEDELEVVFVVDGSPDDSYVRLRQAAPQQPFRSQIVCLSRNYGAFAAIRAGIAASHGERFAVLAADLQEPLDLVVAFDRILLADQADVVVGQRVGRADPFLSRLASRAFWGTYRRLVQKEIPPGGADVFGGNRRVRRQLVMLRESNSSLVGLLFWIGFRRVMVPYQRKEREHGKSSWSFGRKLRYLSDSLFAFTDLPIRLLLGAGVLGLLTSVLFGGVVVLSKFLFYIPVPGYAATATLIVFFGGLNCFGIGILGGYLWRTFENSKRRPNYIVLSREEFRNGRPET
ncbi:MAG: glycosyltransferase family 2 protein [Deltaproteobacteria bacterium]|nr:glycosyltransferase family 2 protein [Deltaproteobacteria bacterium]